MFCFFAFPSRREFVTTGKRLSIRDNLNSKPNVFPPMFGYLTLTMVR